MKFLPTALPGVVIVEAEPAGDARGWFARHFCPEEFTAAGLGFTPYQISQSFNAATHTLRGLHFQRGEAAEAKLVRCLSGTVFDVAVDIRPDSPTRYAWTGATLSSSNGQALLIPRGFAHGFITLEADTSLLYMTDAPYTPSAEGGLRWDDPRLAIDWPARPAVLSPRDQSFALIA
ncbi:MAG: dTDP-4-dehydrorhamnose 3,5-epimerase [Pseudomonadota bacterium]